MARVLGKAGRYTTDEALRQRDRIWQTCVLGCTVVGGFMGLTVSVFVPLPRFGTSQATLVMLALLLGLILFTRVSLKKLDALDRKRDDMRRGASGETAVGLILDRFPSDYFVINGLSTPYGDLDHVVIGSTGVFALDSKNWRGVVTADGKGELLLNGNPTDKAFVRQFVGRIMGIKQQVQMLVQKQRGLAQCDPYFQPVFVFTSATVRANWGTTSALHCLRDEQLWDYIVENKRNQKLSKHEVLAVARAFAALAKTDAAFISTEAAQS